jgi:hypothetical protein
MLVLNHRTGCNQHPVLSTVIVFTCNQHVVIMTNLSQNTSEALQNEINMLYESVVNELKMIQTQHIDPMIQSVSNHGNYRRIQVLLFDLQALQTRLQTIQAFERVQRFEQNQD